MACLPDIHIGQSVCALCKQTPTVGSHILDLAQNSLTIPECRDPCGPCLRSPYPSVWFHAACYNVLEKSYEPSKKPTFEDLGRFADATRPTYKSQNKKHEETASTLEGLFSRYTKDIIQDSFSQSLLAQLPAEIRIIICGLITPCWYLIVLGETRRLIELLRNNSIPQYTQLRLAQEIWMARIIYHGTSYITRLSEKPVESIGNSYECHIKLPSDINRIIVSFDSIGVHGIQFLEHGSNPISDGSPWYEIFEVKDSHLEIYVSHDGLFIRGIHLTSSDLSSRYRIWSSPLPPTIHQWNFYHHPWNFGRAQDKPRLDYVKFDSYTQGLIVCCADARTIGIHGFSGTSTTFKDFVDLIYRKSRKGYIQWIYFPFNRYEYLEAAWVRKSKVHRGPAFYPILVLCTSLGRGITFGPQFPTHLINYYEYYPLVRDGDGAISGICHNGLDPASQYISEFGVTCSGQYRIKTPEPPLDTCFEPPMVPPGRGSPACTWYMTKAPLKGLIKAQVCRDKEQLHSPCIGLLLFYSDQHIESLGQVRWDYDLTQQVLKPTYVEKGVIDGRNYIKDIWSDINHSKFNAETDIWQRLPEDGIIVWWFSKLDDRIITYS
ncbi:hypothetical protein BDV38DRAFT_231964 [Aspergillus pseudotamarii]|uniref:Uncharacterized protein n=1 Tax=Aspergillus pseudotamarii TaxID=132259 RepID=A0A5N6TBN4_ASPPS|nr:uncharacterized protein BDV38DRAFT_231964 [Aspergillus pseudotamarii]KAE8143712.1 hypothetical protein BDV38DRAFT_231964 [Aspergillus pseudotamarii]